MTVENERLQSLDGDQRRETVNTRQRFDLFREAKARADGYRGSMVFATVNGGDYLLRSFYDPKTGRRRQTSLGSRRADTEGLKAEFDAGRRDAEERLAAARDGIDRQAGINRTLGLGRVPLLAARIVRALDAAGLLGHGLRVVGTHALYAYEAAAGLRFAPDVTTTEDIDLLFDARASIVLQADEDLVERSLMGLLRRVDRSFERGRQAFRAANRDGFLVDLVRPMRIPPWRDERSGIADSATDLDAVQIEGLIWSESAPAFAAVAVDVRGFPLRMVAPDPRAFAVHKLWLSRRVDRDPLKTMRDAAQARAVAGLVARHMPQLPFRPEEMRSFPRDVVAAAVPLFAIDRSPDARFDG